MRQEMRQTKLALFTRIIRRLVVIMALVFLLPIACANEEVNLNSAEHSLQLNVFDDITVRGKVSCQGVGVPNVVVSDGVEVVRTDSDGLYSLHSAKTLGYVFISIPSGYSVAMDGNTPQFFHLLNSHNRKEHETIDFDLVKENTDKHAVFTIADSHLAGRNNDVQEFAKVANDINSTITELRGQGYKVYGLSLGDESWDVYWNRSNFTIKEAREEFRRITAPVFHNMGNHDGNPHEHGDYAASQAFVNSCGPTYYSFNLGCVHYVVLDNVEYLNDGATKGKMSRCNYVSVVDTIQLEWLKRDLQQVKDETTPIVVAMHVPLYKDPRLIDGNQNNTFFLNNGSALEDVLSRFHNVQILSGHLHQSYHVQYKENILEHNVPSVCGSWWWTQKLSGNSICQDGSPGGYEVFRWNARKSDWYYKGTGLEKSYQFRAYDLNTVNFEPEIIAPSYAEDLKSFVNNYKSVNKDNQVLINVWNYDPLWKVEVLENGHQLDVQKVNAYDPLHFLSYVVPLIKEGKMEDVHFFTKLSAHMFMAQASLANSTLHIRITDRFGNVYAEDMVRPKSFSVLIK